MQNPTPQGQCAIHPERSASSVCPRCGNFTCGECNPDGQTLCPACRQLGEAAIAYAPTPWERRSELGLVQGLFETWKKSLFEPVKFWPSVDPNASQFDALLYGWIIATLASLFSMPVLFLNFAQMVGSFDKLAETSAQFKEITTMLNGVGPAVFALSLGLTGIVLYPLGLALMAGLTYLGGMVFGASQNGFNATFRAIAYSSGPRVFGFVPVVGGLAGLWALVMEIWAVKELQRTSVPRAIGATLWWLVLFCCCFVVLAVMFGAAMASKLKGGG